jgi:type VI secretion system secreted protein Hcp
MAGVLYSIRLGDIAGASTVKGHEKEIDVLSFAWGVHVATPVAAGTGAASGKAQFDQLRFTIASSVASPQIMLACAQGRHLRDVVLSGRPAEPMKGVGDPVVITLTDVVITDYGTSAASGDLPIEEVALTFQRIKVRLVSGAAVTEAGWDVAKNAPA